MVFYSEQPILWNSTNRVWDRQTVSLSRENREIIFKKLSLVFYDHTILNIAKYNQNFKRSVWNWVIFYSNFKPKSEIWIVFSQKWLFLFISILLHCTELNFHDFPIFFAFLKVINSFILTSVTMMTYSVWFYKRYLKRIMCT